MNKQLGEHQSYPGYMLMITNVVIHLFLVTVKVRLEVMGKKAKNTTYISGNEAGRISREVSKVEKFMLVEMAGSKNIEAAGQTGFEAKMQDSFEDDKSKILMIHFGIGHNMASGNKENQLLEMKQQCPPNAMLHIDLEVISWKVGSL
ncbi:unnamed protein product [Miscanthus lutarioriparius]|uniref:Uncharacterized protein n=1 Tax=Miscanthus lutarioriparius TaxID=422564 RepID=A0A811RTT9_9POAL|nr:unnamed protein product [Miscanthus lutarioriparius]